MRRFDVKIDEIQSNKQSQLKTRCSFELRELYDSMTRVPSHHVIKVSFCYSRMSRCANIEKMQTIKMDTIG
jgi:hypothetical protein